MNSINKLNSIDVINGMANLNILDRLIHGEEESKNPLYNYALNELKKDISEPVEDEDDEPEVYYKDIFKDNDDYILIHSLSIIKDTEYNYKLIAQDYNNNRCLILDLSNKADIFEADEKGQYIYKYTTEYTKGLIKNKIVLPALLNSPTLCYRVVKEVGSIKGYIKLNL